MTNYSYLHNNRCTWFEYHKSGKIIKKKKQESLSTNLNYTPKYIYICQRLIAQHQGTVFLFKTGFEDNFRMGAFHHLTSVGGTIYKDGTNHAGFIQKLGDCAVITMIMDIDTIYNKTTIINLQYQKFQIS